MEGEFITATTLLLTLVIVVVGELSASLREIDLNQLLSKVGAERNVNLYTLGRFYIIHCVNLSFLFLSYMYVALSVGETSLSIANAALILVMVVLPIIEVTEYDQIFQNIEIYRLNDYISSIPLSIAMNAFFVCILYIMVRFNLIGKIMVPVGILILPFVSGAIFVKYLVRELGETNDSFYQQT